MIFEKQFEYKNWKVTFSFCHQFGCFGHFALPGSIGWWYSGSKNFEISLDILCFTFHIEIWKWVKGE